jgi:DeoR family suf operon transcriptional repressor
MAAEADADLFQTTRGKLLLSLCRGPRTVNELMDELSLTDNAIRAQLQNLQDAGLVRPLGLRPGTRKPHVEYELTPNARRLFPQAHERVFLALMDVLHEQLPAQQTEALLKDVGRRVLIDWVGQLREREPRRRVAELYRRIVGVAAGVSLEQAPGRSTLRACGCPLASLTAAHPETCAALAAVLGEVLGTTVRDRCDRTDVPQCRFEIADG